MIRPVPKPPRPAKKPRAWNSTLGVARTEGTRPPKPSQPSSSLPDEKSKSRGAKKQQVAGAARASRSKPIARKSAIRKRPKSASKFREQYGSKERVAFVKSLPCAFCATVGYSQNAHVGERSGMGLKGHYTEIAPLCGPWSRMTSEGPLDHPGCHRLFDEWRWPLNAEEVRDRIQQIAATVEAAWQQKQAGDSSTPRHTRK